MLQEAMRQAREFIVQQLQLHMAMARKQGALSNLHALTMLDPSCAFANLRSCVDVSRVCRAIDLSALMPHAPAVRQAHRLRVLTLTSQCALQRNCVASASQAGTTSRRLSIGTRRPAQSLARAAIASERRVGVGLVWSKWRADCSRLESTIAIARQRWRRLHSAASAAQAANFARVSGGAASAGQPEPAFDAANDAARTSIVGHAAAAAAPTARSRIASVAAADIHHAVCG